MLLSRYSFFFWGGGPTHAKDWGLRNLVWLFNVTTHRVLKFTTVEGLLHGGCYAQLVATGCIIQPFSGPTSVSHSWNNYPIRPGFLAIVRAPRGASASTMATAMSSELRASFRNRIRHIHLPDLPPLYAPRSLPGKIRDVLHSQILSQRDTAEASAGSESNEATGDLVAGMRAWLRQASPPPTVLSFTRRPTYVLPKHFMTGREPWEVEYVTANMKTQQDVIFPEPPQWSLPPFMRIWNTETDSMALQHNPLAHKWEPGVMILPCAEPMYFGPGQISIWPVMDLLDDLQRGKKFNTKYEYERILEDTTIQVLKREYGLEAFSIPGKPGVWVESLIPPSELSDVDSFGIKLFDQTVRPKYQHIRRIATIHADFVNSITRHGVSIHVGQPAPDADRFGDLRVNPWAVIRQDRTTTSIVAELALKGRAPRRNMPEAQEVEHRSDRKSLYLQTDFDENSPHVSQPLQAMPYSLVSLIPGLRQPMPMGLDNRDLSTAWTHEFARQLGLLGGIIDHLSNVNFPSPTGSLPTRQRHVGFMSRPVMGEDQLVAPYEQVEVPAIQLRVGGSVTEDILQNTQRIETKDKRIIPNAPAESWAISWPLYYSNLKALLDNSIRGRSWDTRLSQLVRSQTVEARIDRRWQAIREAQEFQDAWRIYQKPRGYQSQTLSESLAAKLTQTTKDMRDILQGLEAGRVNIPKQKLLAKTERLEKLLKSQRLDADNGPEKSSGSVAEKIDASLWIKKLDDTIRSAKRVLKQARSRTPISVSEDTSRQTIESTTQSSDHCTELEHDSRAIADVEEVHQNLVDQLKDHTLSLKPNTNTSFRFPFQLTPTRAERRALKDIPKDPAAEEQRMARVKMAKLGAPEPRPLYQPLPTRREKRERREREKALTGARSTDDKSALLPLPRDGGKIFDKLKWLMPSTERVQSVQ